MVFLHKINKSFSFLLEQVTINSLENIMVNINNEYEKYNENDGNQNCMLCTWALEMQLRGNNDFLPRPVYSPRDIIFNINGYDFVKNASKISIEDKEDVINKVRKAKDGARFYCHVNWKGSNGGHEFLLLNINDEVYLADAQSNVLVKVEDDKEYFDDINFSNSYIMRVDDKQINENILKYNDDDYIIEWNDKLDIPLLEEYNKKDLKEDLTESNHENERVERFKIKVKDKEVGKYGLSFYEDIKAVGIGDLEIYPEYRNKGYGTQAIKHIIDKYKKDYDLIYCYVDKNNEGAIRLYKKLGKVYDEVNEDGNLYVVFYSKNKLEESVTKIDHNHSKAKLKNDTSFSIWTEYEANYDNQTDCMKIAYLGDNWLDDNDRIVKENLLGYLEYSYDPNEKPRIAYVNMIEVKESMRRKGIASALIESLIQDFGKDNIEWGYTTEEGTRLLKRLGFTQK